MNHETLKSYAQRLSQFPSDANAYSNLVVRLQLVDDVSELKALARQFMLSPEVALVVWRRIGGLVRENPADLVDVAMALYSNGYDEEATPLVERALELDDCFIMAWELKAALTSDPSERKRVLERILAIEPGNRRAVDNLILLGESKG